MDTETKNQIRRYILTVATVFLAVVLMILLLVVVDSHLPAPQDPTVPPPTGPTVPPSHVTAGNFSMENGFLVCNTEDYLTGVDISVFQGKIDWAQVKAAGVDFVMVRLGYRGYTVGGLNTDGAALANIQGAREAGLLVGAYFFSQATNVEEAEEEARYCLEVLGDTALDLPLAFDWEPEERTANTNGKTVTDCAIAFCSIVEDAGRKSMIYFNNYQARQFLELTRLTDYPWWLAQYNTTDNFYCRWQMWQYSCTGTVPGISTPVDLNVLLVGESV